MFTIPGVPMRALLLALAMPLLAQNLPMPANLKAEGLAPIPLALMKELSRYSESRGAVLAGWHPVRSEILISTRFGDVPHLHRLALPMGARTQVTFGPERIASGTFEPTKGDFLVYAQDTGGAEFYQLYRLDLQTRKTTLLTDGKSRNTGARFSPDGRWLSFASTRRNGTDNDIWLMDPLHPESARLLLQVQGGGWEALGWSRDGKFLLVENALRITETELYRVEVATGKKVRLSPEGKVAAYGNATFSVDGKGVYLTTDLDSEFQRLAYLDLAKGSFRFLRPALTWDVSSLALSRDGRHLAYEVNEEGLSVLRIMDLANGKDVSLPRLPKGSVAGITWHANSRDLAFTLNGAKSPSDVYSIQLTTKKLTRWTQSETGYADAASFSEPELVRWKSFDGLSLSGFLYLPRKAGFQGPRPVIVNIHGGPESQFKPVYLGQLNYLINELGCAILFPNVRGSNGYGKTFLDLDNGFKREDSVRDIGALLDWITRQPGLDKDRVMVTGGSYGGYMTLACMTHYNDRFRCALDVVGISNFVTFLENTQGYRRDLRRVEYGDERDPKMREFLTRISPTTNAAKITRPMFIVQGHNDPRVPFTEATQMVEVIRRNQGPVWYLEAADEGHGFAKKANRDIQFAATVLFVKEHLTQ
jgi:dipeptidyl aminopeptidase/acylaminoacyl peptidase